MEIMITKLEGDREIHSEVVEADSVDEAVANARNWLTPSEQRRYQIVGSECEQSMVMPMELWGNDGPLSDELIMGDHAKVVARFRSMSGLDALRVLLMVYRRSDAVVGDREIDDLAEYLGVFED